MERRYQIHLNDLEVYSKLYILIGEVELILRERIPTTLSSNLRSKVHANWTSPLLFNLKCREAITVAMKRNQNRFLGLEDALPLSFWVALFSKQNFDNLWIPYLSTSFPKLKNPHSRKSYNQIVVLMRELLKIRNQVAHFNYLGNLSMEKAITNKHLVLSQIIELLG